ncbi:hypothetical protein D9757_014031 [Collybiopsis confluens]|uniref:Uncharacterized protein n=1 Tax=Collybiopsis confluens TaxID=2823264 RepID=A0A8H5FPF5_9AGAR|nr:hypothetical protein D9757_014031 [Collybiopsis confluens]
MSTFEILSPDVYSLFQGQLQLPLTILILELMFFGAYTIIFGLYLYLQVHQQGRQRYYQGSILLLFLLGGAAVAVSICHFVKICLSTLSAASTELNTDFDSTTQSGSLELALRAIYAAANTVADALLLYRCYIAWGSKKWIILGPGFISASNTIMAIVAVYFLWKTNNPQVSDSASTEASDLFDIFLGLNLFTNVLLTGLIAGRLWRISRSTRQYLGEDSIHRKRMNRIVGLILESGSLYPLALIAYIVVATIPKKGESMEPLLTVIVGIAPTMIMVRVDLGNSINKISGSSSGDRRFSDLEALPLPPIVRETRNSEIPRPFFLSLENFSADRAPLEERTPTTTFSTASSSTNTHFSKTWRD